MRLNRAVYWCDLPRKTEHALYTLFVRSTNGYVHYARTEKRLMEYDIQLQRDQGRQCKAYKKNLLKKCFYLYARVIQNYALKSVSVCLQ